jgi:hypothetical protein
MMLVPRCCRSARVTSNVLHRYVAGRLSSRETVIRRFGTGTNKAPRPLPAEELIAKTPPKQIQGYVAKCDGGEALFLSS